MKTLVLWETEHTNRQRGQTISTGRPLTHSLQPPAGKSVQKRTRPLRAPAPRARPPLGSQAILPAINPGNPTTTL